MQLKGIGSVQKATSCKLVHLYRYWNKCNRFIYIFVLGTCRNKQNFFKCRVRKKTQHAQISQAKNLLCLQLTVYTGLALATARDY